VEPFRGKGAGVGMMKACGCADDCPRCVRACASVPVECSIKVSELTTIVVKFSRCEWQTIL
jgi:hypothetical protein